ncbi:MAG TPA: hypothetical protein PLI79_11305 [Mycobacterium sp.]|nr:hypothetical protein [Mycolicibacterium sp.]HMZ15271.1 hypothetical protein [Mycobacterium sp.]HNA50894.1 hypothetical protein [Mycobacterium sp.]HNM11121.1 hypothetical protein [Mycobacterium sp.]HRD12439.1 hypothetical protein [Mycobacterium sp.]
MRMVVVFAASALLAAGCSGDSGQARHTQLTPITPSRTATTTSATSTTPSAAPAAGVPIAEVIKWVAAAGPVDAAQYHVALRPGSTVQLGDDVAFTTPSGTTCMTDAKHGTPGLACLVDLTDPPPQPPDVYGVWKGGWVDFDGAGVQVGSAHGDPGRFSNGQGPELPYDRSLSFGDYRCRTDETALFCVNYAHQSAVRFSAGGIDTYACARQLTPPAGIGVQYVC